MPLIHKIRILLRLNKMKQNGATRVVKRTGPIINRAIEEGRIGEHDVNLTRRRNMAASIKAAIKTNPALAR